MKPRTLSLMTLGVIAGLSLTAAANAKSGLEDLDSRTSKQVRACVEEVGRRADYDDAERVVHVIATLEQKNLEEMAISVETSVHLAGNEEDVRAYTARCITGTMGEMVKFRFDVAEQAPHTAAN